MAEEKALKVDMMPARAAHVRCRLSTFRRSTVRGRSNQRRVRREEVALRLRQYAQGARRGMERDKFNEGEGSKSEGENGWA